MYKKVCCTCKVAFMIQTSDGMQYFATFQDKLHSVQFITGRTANLAPLNSENLYGQPVVTFERCQSYSGAVIVCLNELLYFCI